MYPTYLQVVLDCTNARELAEFYRALLGYVYRPGHDVVDPAGDDWLVIHDGHDHNRIAFQQVEHMTASTWPADTVPQQLHLDLTVPDTDALNAQHERALALGARLVMDRFDDPQEPLRVYADPVGHPFCIFVG